MFEHIYIHIPFCHRICHYCDFAKTANFDHALKKNFFKALYQHTEYLLQKNPYKIQSVFLGGGTPSIYDEEYLSFFELFKKHMLPDCEITIEVNPEDLQKEKIQLWLQAGINRISVGVQSFNDQALEFLTRSHRKKNLESYLETLFKEIPKNVDVNFDLIYAWPNQEKIHWLEDLKTSTQYPIQHLSCYSLSYEPGTVLGRKYSRGLITNALEDQAQFERYEEAYLFLQSLDFDHYEISNFSKKNHRSKHNCAYWTYKNYLAIGPGAHGFFGSNHPSESLRYSCKSSIHRYCEEARSLDWTDTISIEEHIQTSNIYNLEEKPSISQWLLDYLASSLRFYDGVQISFACQAVHKDFIMNSTLKRAEEMALIRVKYDALDKNKIKSIQLSEREWFREHAWILQIHSCFV